MDDDLEATTEDQSARRPAAAGRNWATGPVKVDFAALSDAGKVRSHNEDHFLILRMGRTLRVMGTNLPDSEVPAAIEEYSYAIVVADGMGGMAAGERASKLALRTGIDLVLNSPRWATKIDEHEARALIGRLREYFRKIDATLIGESRSHQGLKGMGTTLTLAYSVGFDVFVVHVGDSRAYLFREGKLERLTHDHTMAQRLADVGAIKPEEVPTHATRHVLTNFMGGPTHGVEPEVSTHRLRPGDILLLCTDGLTEMVGENEVAQLIRMASTLDDAVRALVHRALEKGGRDNVTVALARYEIAD